MQSASHLIRSLSLFLLAGLCEIGGGWLVWKWLRDDKPSWWGFAGALVVERPVAEVRLWNAE